MNYSTRRVGGAEAILSRCGSGRSDHPVECGDERCKTRPRQARAARAGAEKELLVLCGHGRREAFHRTGGQAGGRVSQLMVAEDRSSGGKKIIKKNRPQGLTSAEYS